MESLNDVVKIIKELRGVSSSKAKSHIILKNKDNEVFKKVLYYCYDDNMKYGIKKTTIDKMQFDPDNDYRWNCIWNMFDDLSKENINNDLVLKVSNTIGYFSDEGVRDLLIKVLLKDLKCNINKKSINKVIPGLIPIFGVQLAESYDKYKKIIDGETEFILTTKLDGNRMICINKNGIAKFYTRTGKSIEGLIELEREFKKMPDGVYDGECLAVGIYKDSAEQYKETQKRAKIKGNKVGLQFVCYDFIENEEDFWNGKCNTKCIDRKNKLRNILSIDLEFIKYLAPLYIGKDTNMIEEYSKLATENHEEGIMLNVANAPYETKRVKSLLKVKLFKSADVLVEAIHEGEGKLVGMLGKVTVSYLYEGNKYSVDCGTGFNEYQRKLYYENPELISGKVCTIKFFEVTKNQNGGYGLRFPCWLDIIRDDKNGIEDTHID